MLVMESCCHYWNTCLPLAPISVERGLLHQPLSDLIRLVAVFVDRRKESALETSGNFDQNCNIVLAMYGLVFQAYADKVTYCKHSLVFLM